MYYEFGKRKENAEEAILSQERLSEIKNSVKNLNLDVKIMNKISCPKCNGLAEIRMSTFDRDGVEATGRYVVCKCGRKIDVYGTKKAAIKRWKCPKNVREVIKFAFEWIDSVINEKM